MDSDLQLRPPDVVMKLERLGAFHQTRLSFVRSLMRQIARERWEIKRPVFELDDRGFGTAVYQIHAAGDEIYSVVIFSQFIADDERTDRVIAEKWDIAGVLCEGVPDETRLAELREQVPLQEAGRNKTDALVLSRANKSGRNFNSVVNCLAKGEQPDRHMLTRVGYLVRTTAVYGNGKFGLADYAKLKRRKTFTRSFSAQLFTVYMIRHFSLELVEHMAQRKAPDSAAALDPAVKRFLGVGNATGLGMAPFLIKHPGLIHRWVLARETALARVLAAPIEPRHFDCFHQMLEKARTHFEETYTDDRRQMQNNRRMIEEITTVQEHLADRRLLRSFDWQQLMAWAGTGLSLETQELLASLLMELYPDRVDDLEDTMVSEEDYRLQPAMPIKTLRGLVEHNYDWALQIDYAQPRAQHFFWYRSAEKEEPRLGERFLEPGAEKEQQLAIGRAVAELHDHLNCLSEAEQNKPVVHFLLRQPRFKGIIRRVQSLAASPYAEIRDNILDAGCLPLHILRAKLSIFGASKFDPKSNLWTRITLFQGAPLVEDFEQPFKDNWYFPHSPGPNAAGR